MVYVPEFHLGKTLLDNGMTKILITLVLIVLAPMIPLYILNISSPIWLPSKISESRKCDIFRGKWIPYQSTPYYNNATCREISDQQNCMKFGRPDTDFLKWKWKPDKCELPRFDSEQFLELVRGKSMAFIGDSLGRNQMQSLQCLLSRVVYPEDIVSYTEDARFKRWFYVNYNFTLASSWAPHLVRTIDTDPDGPTYNRLLNLYLDEADHAWAAQVEKYDYVIISAGRWFYGPQVFYENGKAVGCHLCLKNTIKNLTMFYGYRKAFRTSFKTLISLARFSGVTFLRTLSPAHFENGEWNKGGNCVRTRPVSKGEMKLDGDDLELYLTQVQELRRAKREGRRKGLDFRLLDISAAMVVRPDGHPSHYGNWPHENVTIADCVHWCLPGAIDTWNELLLQMLKRERSRGAIQ